MMFLFSLFWILFSTGMKAQANLDLIFNTLVGCQDGINKDGRTTYEEFITFGTCLNVCSQSEGIYWLNTANVTNLSTVWHINPGTGGSIIQQSNSSVTIKWGTSGTGYLGLIATTAQGIKEFSDICVSIIKSPIANFTSAPNNVSSNSSNSLTACANEPIQFTNFSSSNGGTAITNYFWNFGVGSYSTEIEPTHTYMQAGQYEVSLTVGNACSCNSTKTTNFNILEGAEKPIKIECAAMVCDGQIATYSIADAQDYNCSKFDWKVISGTILSPQPYGKSIDVKWSRTETNQWSSTGFGYVSVILPACGMICDSNTPKGTIKIPIIQNVGVIQGDAKICGFENRIYKLPQWASTNFNWEVLNNNTNATIVVTDSRNEILLKPGNLPGIIRLQCGYQNTLLNCGGAAILTIKLEANANIVGSNIACKNTTEIYTIEGGATGDWKLTNTLNGQISTGSGNSFTANFPNDGDYTLMVSGTNFCNQAIKHITVKTSLTKPTVDQIIGTRIICPGTPTTYSIASPPAETITGWEITNGTIIGSPFGNEITVNWNSPSQNDPLSTLQVYFQNIVGQPCPSEKTTITVELENIIINIDGETKPCFSSIKNYNTSYTAGEIYEWKISPPEIGNIILGQGTGNISVLWNQFQSQKNAILTLFMTKCNSIYSFSKAIIVNSPVITIQNSQTSVCTNQNVNYTFTSNPPLDLPLIPNNIEWDFGDGTVLYGQNVTHAYTSVPVPNIAYTIKLKVTSPNGCPNSVTALKTMQVLPKPVANITPIESVVFCPGGLQSTTLYANISTGYGSTASIKWYKNNVEMVNFANSNQITVTTIGTYYAKVANTNLCEDTTNYVYVNACQPIENPPGGGTACSAPDIQLTNLPNNCQYKRIAASAIGGGAIFWTTASWYCSNASLESSTLTDAYFNFPQPGTYTVSMSYKAVNSSGVMCSNSKNITIIKPYTAGIKYKVECNTNNTYTVTLFDHSVFFAGTPITIRRFYVNNVEALPLQGETLKRVLTLPAGNYTFKIEIGNGNYALCSANTTTQIGAAAPDATFTHSNNVCEGYPIDFWVTNPQNNQTYLWNFGVATNAQQNPQLVLNSIEDPQVTLTVTNRYGCTSSQTKSDFNIHKNPDYQGTVVQVAEACEGDPLFLKFVPNQQNQIYPAHYQWMKGNVPIPNSDSVTVLVPGEGSYWVKGTDMNGCFQNITPAFSAIYTKIPMPIISGSHHFCLEQSMQLSSNGQNQNGLSFSWILESVVVGTNANLNLDDLPVGTYVFKLMFSKTLSDGSICSKTSSGFEVEITENALIPQVAFEVLNCDPYRVKITATSDSPGYFNWSNGDYGPISYVSHGGPFMVTFKNFQNCSNSALINVPYEPAKYLWTFPTGCYDFCNTVASSSILGPGLAKFDQWNWLQDEQPILSGIDQVAQLDLTAAGKYNIALQTGECIAKSKDAFINLEECACTIDAKILSVVLLQTPFNRYKLQIFIANPSTVAMSVTIAALNDIGYFQPGTVIVPPGGGTFLITMLPFATFFGGGTMLIFRGFDTYKNQPCEGRLECKFPEILPNKSNRDQSVYKNNLLLVSPNPIVETTEVQFSLSKFDNNTIQSIEIFDFFGNPIQELMLQSQSGKLDIASAQWEIGTYIVLLKQDNEILSQQIVFKK